MFRRSPRVGAGVVHAEDGTKTLQVSRTYKALLEANDINLKDLLKGNKMEIAKVVNGIADGKMDLLGIRIFKMLMYTVGFGAVMFVILDVVSKRGPPGGPPATRTVGTVHEVPSGSA
ncbi:unnamed protein product [Peronospora belbahrii]|uniref:Uncharacterized protein n=1 Tax=Peronospora belbahrii TaxID=622444 RepID=A0AAU9KQI0_9STRA|nr:unnamed protein product [Peronospora belbahrii]